MRKKLFYAIICGLLLMLFSGCDSGLWIVRYDFGQYPRLVYIANVDTELDFSGATIFYTQRDRFQSDEYPLILGDWITIEHSIDFTTPGEYEVKIVLHGTHDQRHHRPDAQFPITFTVQVIDE